MKLYGTQNNACSQYQVAKNIKKHSHINASQCIPHHGNKQVTMSQIYISGSKVWTQYRLNIPVSFIHNWWKNKPNYEKVYDQLLWLPVDRLIGQSVNTITELNVHMQASLECLQL